MKNLFLDFESYYSKDVGFSKQSTTEYIEDPQFHITGLGLNFNGDTKYFYMLKDELFAPDGHHFLYEKDPTSYSELLHYYPWDDINLICHNVQFDGYILHHLYNIHPKKYSCTRSMAKGISFHDSAQLKDVAPKYGLGHKGKELADFKGVWELTHGEQIDMKRYCSQDVNLTVKIYNKLLEYYPESELELIDSTARFFCEPTLQIDQPRLQKYIDALKQNRDEAIETVSSICTEDELMSNIKYANVLRRLTDEEPPMKVNDKTIGLPPEHHVYTYAFSRDDISYVRYKRNHPELIDIFKARAAAKETNELNKAERIMQHKKGVPVALTYSGAHTKRFSGSNKTNLQALKRGGELRKSLIAPPGHQVVVADLGQIEPRVTSWLAGNQRYLDIFADPTRDIYCEEYNAINGTNITKQDNPIERFIGKQIVISLGYGQGWKKFQTNMEIQSVNQMGQLITFTDEEAKKLVEGYRRVNYQVPILWKTLEGYAQKMMEKDTHIKWKGMDIVWERIFTHNGLFLHYPNLRISKDEKTNRSKIMYANGYVTWGGTLTENLVQHLSRNIICDHLLAMKKEGIQIVHTVHDELVAVAKNDEAEDVYRRMLEIMTTPPEWCKDLPLSAEGGYANNYSK